MSEQLPLFPLGTVLYPGLVLPMHIFEDRYKQLVRDLIDGPEPRRFGVIAIREGRETGDAGVTSLFEVGCVAAVQEVTELDEGQYNLISVGTDRFRLIDLIGGAEDVQAPRPYLRAEVELLPEPAGDERTVPLAVSAVQNAFRHYLDQLAESGSATISVPDVPDEPILLSYLVAASMVIELSDRQELLAKPDAVTRLRAERSLLARETAMIKALGATPAPDLRSSPYSPN